MFNISKDVNVLDKCIEMQLMLIKHDQSHGSIEIVIRMRSKCEFKGKIKDLLMWSKFSNWIKTYFGTTRFGLYLVQQFFCIRIYLAIMLCCMHVRETMKWIFGVYVLLTRQKGRKLRKTFVSLGEIVGHYAQVTLSTR